MTVTIYSMAAIALFVLGLYGLWWQPHLLRKLVSLNIASAGAFLLMVALAFRGGDPDPVPHALVLTGIVISVSATAFAVVLAARRYRETGAVELDDPEERP